MKARAVFLIGFLLAAPPSWSADPMASEASVRQLLEITRSRKLMDDTMGQMDSYMRTAMNQALGGKIPTADEQAILDDMNRKVVALMQQEVRWDILEPKFIALYRQSFTEQEIAGMLSFYRTPAGQAVITKMPVVMQNTMATMQDLMGMMVPQMQAIQNEALQRLKAKR
jgi:hypothetical protein